MPKIVQASEVPSDSEEEETVEVLPKTQKKALSEAKLKALELARVKAAQKAKQRLDVTRGFTEESRQFFDHAHPDKKKLLDQWSKDADKGGAAAPPSAPAGSRVAPPEGAIRLLRATPNPQTIKFFEEKYGPGTARQYLSDRGAP